MTVETKYIQVPTKGFCDVIDITDKVESALSSVGDMTEGSVTIFVPGSTAGVTTLEYESGCIEDLKSAFERLAPEEAHYAHNTRWGDDRSKGCFERLTNLSRRLCRRYVISGAALLRRVMMNLGKTRPPPWHSC